MDFLVLRFMLYYIGVREVGDVSFQFVFSQGFEKLYWVVVLIYGLVFQFFLKVRQGVIYCFFFLVFLGKKDYICIVFQGFWKGKYGIGILQIDRFYFYKGYDWEKVWEQKENWDFRVQLCLF